MRLTVVLLLATLLVTVAGVWWVNSRSRAEPFSAEVLPTAVTSDNRSFASPRDDVAAQVARIDALQSGPYEKLTKAQRAQQERQFAAERARIRLDLKGCMDTGNACKCLNSDNRVVAVSVEVCQMVASEPQVMQQ